MPRFTFALQSHRSIESRSTPVSRSPSVRAACGGRPGASSGRRYRVPLPRGRKPDGISRSAERHFDCCWSER